MKRFQRIGLILTSLYFLIAWYGRAEAADVKISALPAGTTLAGTEVAPFVQSAATVKITPAQIATYVLSVAPALPAGANPTGTVGLTAVNGSATSFLRSDGAPALSQAISPTWSGTHIFSNAVTGASFIPTSASIPTNGMYLSATNQLNFATNSTGRGFFTSGGEFDITVGEKLSNATIPYLTFNVSGQSANARAWGAQATGAVFSMNAQDDAGGTIRNILAATRSGAALTDVSFGNATNNNTFTFLGTGLSTFTGNLLQANAAPLITLDASGAGADLKNWTVGVSGTTFNIGTTTDAGSAGTSVLTATRGTTTSVSNVTIGNATSNPTYTFAGSGGVAASSFTANVIVSNNNMSLLNAAPQFVWQESDQGTDLKRWQQVLNGAVWTFDTQTDAAGAGTNIMVVTRGTTTTVKSIAFGAPLLNTGVTFTTTGCSVSATAGGGSAGTFTLGANSCSVVITMNGATGSTAANGWTCQAHDRTAPTILIGGESSSTVTTATIPIPVTAGTTDVISFSCTGY